MPSLSSLYLRGELSSIDTAKYRFNFEGFPNQLTDADPMYRPLLPEEFLQSSFERSIWRLKVDDTHLDVAQWETPKRTRTYPLARCYRQLQSPFKKVALIPIVKDEGSGVNPDVLGIETIYLLDLFGFFVVTAKYIEARPDERVSERTGRTLKILRDQKLDFTDALEKLRIVAANEVTSHAWNRGEVLHFADSLEEAADAYQKIHDTTGVPLPTIASCRARVERIRRDGLEAYLADSDARKRRSQHSETSGVHPKEHLALLSEKVSVDVELKTDLGLKSPVLAHLVPDEGWRLGDVRIALEKKANPTEHDLLDALFKGMAFRNAKISNAEGPVHFGIGATYKARRGACWSLCPEFDTCQQAQFESCEFEPLQSLNQNADFGRTTASRNLLKEGHNNRFLTFVIGVKDLNPSIESEAQQAILNAFIKAD